MLSSAAGNVTEWNQPEVFITIKFESLVKLVFVDVHNIELKQTQNHPTYTLVYIKN